MRHRLLIAGIVGCAAAVGAGFTLTPQKADSFAQKLSAVLARSDTPASEHVTEFSNDELNAYLQLRMAPTFPPGVTEPVVTFVGQGRLIGRAIVDLDGLRKKSSGGWFDPAAYLAGKLPVTAVGTLRTANGIGQLALERAEVGGVPVPLTLLQELVTLYTKSSKLPAGFNLNEPFELPSHIQRIEVGAGLAVVVQ